MATHVALRPVADLMSGVHQTPHEGATSTEHRPAPGLRGLHAPVALSMGGIVKDLSRRGPVAPQPLRGHVRQETVRVRSAAGFLVVEVGPVLDLLRDPRELRDR
jgi:hypothetical protein